MADYLVTGKKGNGKSLVVVGRMVDAIRQGRIVATNLDLFPEHFLKWNNKKARIIRLPDRPSIFDLECIGVGNETLDEEKNGILVLDELSTFMNARSYTDKGRQDVLDWLAHSRKLGWDTYLIAQSPVQVDKQLREALCEYLVICRRMDRIRVPYLRFRLPRFHMAFVRFGMGNDSLLADKWVYRGNHLFGAYDTRQVLRSNYPHGPHSILPPGYYSDRPSDSWIKQFFRSLLGSSRRRVEKPKHRLVRLLERLPADQRIRHFQRFEFLGAFDRPF